jgi:hypothetical protein
MDDKTELSPDQVKLFSDDDSEEWQEWYRMTPLQRLRETSKLWEAYLSFGGSLEADPDSQSPFDAFMPRGEAPAYGRSGMRVVRRGGV